MVQQTQIVKTYGIYEAKTMKRAIDKKTQESKKTISNGCCLKSV